jgi:hypothetical protein
MDTLIEKIQPKTRVKNAIKLSLQEEKQVIVHCLLPCQPGDGVRVWKTTYLIAEDGTKSYLVYWQGISLAPVWTWAMDTGNFRFTLVFTGLPADCQCFSFVEEIPEPGGWNIAKIRRNKSDVYHIRL